MVDKIEPKVSVNGQTKTTSGPITLVSIEGEIATIRVGSIENNWIMTVPAEKVKLIENKEEEKL